MKFIKYFLIFIFSMVIFVALGLLASKTLNLSDSVIANEIEIDNEFLVEGKEILLESGEYKGAFISVLNSSERDDSERLPTWFFLIITIILLVVSLFIFPRIRNNKFLRIIIKSGRGEK